MKKKSIHSILVGSVLSALMFFNVGVVVLAANNEVGSEMNAQNDEGAAAPDKTAMLEQVNSEWRGLTEPIVEIAERLANKYLPADASEERRAELYDQIFSQLAAGYGALFTYNAEHPDFFPLYSQLYDTMWANPDTLYGISPLEADGVYKISGNRGSTRMLDFQLGGQAFMTRGDLSTGAMGVALDNFDADELDIADDGSFEVILSAEKPEGHTGNWWKLASETTYIMYRSAFYDWVNEVDATVAIDRLDRPVPPPQPDPATIKTDLRQVATWGENVVDLALSLATRARNRGLIHKFDFVDWGAEVFSNQRYFVSAFDLAPDEGLLIETDIAENCAYWNFQLVNESWRTFNGMHYQSAINGFQAKIDGDGKFRAVISQADPGIPNWLNTGGENSARVYGRWNKCDTYPLPKATKIKVSEVRDYLPDDTPVVTAAQRDQDQRDRKRLFQLRRRW